MMRPTINPEKKNGRTRTTAKEKPMMERFVARKVAICKAGVAIVTNVGDPEHAYAHPDC